MPRVFSTGSHPEGNVFMLSQTIDGITLHHTPSHFLAHGGTLEDIISYLFLSVALRVLLHILSPERTL